MNTRRTKTGRTAFALCLAIFSCGAHAVPFTISDVSWETTGFEVGSTVDITKGIETPLSFNLAEGESQTFNNLLNVSLSGSGIAGGLIDVTMYFTQPTEASAGGSLLGVGGLILGIGAGGLELISNPGPIYFGDGGAFGISFGGFHATCFFCKDGQLSGSISATVALLKAPAAVPAPGALALLGVGLLVMGCTRRRLRG